MLILPSSSPQHHPGDGTGQQQQQQQKGTKYLRPRYSVDEGRGGVGGAAESQFGNVVLIRDHREVGRESAVAIPTLVARLMQVAFRAASVNDARA